MSVLIFGHDAALADWCAKRIPDTGGKFGPCVAIGVATGNGPDDKLLGVCVFHNYDKLHGLVELSFASTSPRWASRGVIRALLSVPFEQYKCRKVCMEIEHTNKRALRFNEGIGFRREATLRHHFGPHRHVVVLSMMKHEYEARWKVAPMRAAA